MIERALAPDLFFGYLALLLAALVLGLADWMYRARRERKEPLRPWAMRRKR